MLEKCVMLCKSEKFCPPPRFSLAVFFETPNTILESRSCASLLSQQPKRQDCHPRPPLLDSPTLIFFASSSVTLPVLCPPPSNSNMPLSDIPGMEQKPILYISQCKQYTAKMISIHRSSNHSRNTQNCFPLQ